MKCSHQPVEGAERGTAGQPGPDADCPGESVCVEADGNTYCLRTCEVEADCSFCRDPDDAATCTDEVTFVEATGVRVCLP